MGYDYDFGASNCGGKEGRPSTLKGKKLQWRLKEENTPSHPALPLYILLSEFHLICIITSK